MDEFRIGFTETETKPEYYGEIRARTTTSADLYIYGDIVSRRPWYSSEENAQKSDAQWPSKVRDLLAQIKDVTQLNIYINSGGGVCFAGMAIYNMLARHKAHKTVYVDGLAASMASIIALAGDKVVIPANAWMMIHQPWTICWGNATDIEKEIAALRSIEEGMLAVYMAKAKPGVTKEAILKMMVDETWMTGEEAAKYFNVETTTASNAAAWLESEHYGQYKNAPREFIESAAKPAPQTQDVPQPPPGPKLATAKDRLKLKLTTGGKRT
ncbi:MAG: Clp protease ClpP [Defluviitaleaceae bacterium]|nr:Clp protease ClpP [Defluviitaleaceae bacterium]